MYCIILTRVMCYATTFFSTRVVRVGLCVRSFGRGFLPTYESREVSTRCPSVPHPRFECTEADHELRYMFSSVRYSSFGGP